MPRYFFDVENGHRLIDPAGLDRRDDREARAKAIVIAGQIANDVPGSAQHRHLAILNGERREIGEILIAAREVQVLTVSFVPADTTGRQKCESCLLKSDGATEFASMASERCAKK